MEGAAGAPPPPAQKRPQQQRPQQQQQQPQTQTQTQQQQAAPPPAVAALAGVVDRAFAAAEALSSPLPRAVLEMEGMSGAKTRAFYNALCAFDGCRCLHVGVWKGSTVIACLAASGGRASLTAVDDWREFGGPRAEFEAAARALLTPRERAALTVINGDCFDLAPPLPDGHFNVYIYDGAHDYESQVFAITAMWRHLASPAIVVIDDINFNEVRQGTADGLASLGGAYRGGGCVARAWEVRLTDDDSHTPLEEAAAGWWNGLAVFVVDKGGGG